MAFRITSGSKRSALLKHSTYKALPNKSTCLVVVKPGDKPFGSRITGKNSTNLMKFSYSATYDQVQVEEEAY